MARKRRNHDRCPTCGYTPGLHSPTCRLEAVALAARRYLAVDTIKGGGAALEHAAAALQRLREAIEELDRDTGKET